MPGAEMLDDTAWLAARRAEGWTAKGLAKKLHTSHQRVSAALRRAGLPVPIPNYHVPQLHDVDWLTATLREHSLEETARMLGCAPQSVRYVARKYGVTAEVNGHASPRAVAARLDDQEWLARRRSEGATVGDLADELDTSRARVTAAIKAAGLPPLRRNGSAPSFPELYDVDWVRTQLATRTRADVARELGCSTRSVRDAAARAGVPPARIVQPRTERPPTPGGPSAAPQPRDHARAPTGPRAGHPAARRPVPQTTGIYTIAHATDLTDTLDARLLWPFSG